MTETTGALGPYILAAHLARRLGCSTIVDVDGLPGPHHDVLAESFEMVSTTTTEVMDLDSPSSHPEPAWHENLARAIVVCSSSHLDAARLGAVGRLEAAAAAVVTRPSGDNAGGMRLRGTCRCDGENAPVVEALHPAAQPDLGAPPSFQVAAIVTTFNEADIIEQVIEHLIEQGVAVYLIDNWSTDDTVAVASKHLGRGVLHVERFPAEAPSLYYNWDALLRRIEEVAAGLGSAWVIHHDSDEIRRSPWPDVTLRDAIFHVDRCGFSAIDHTVVNFAATEQSIPGGFPLENFAFFEKEAHSSYGLQVKAWKNPGTRVEFLGGGHDVALPGKRVFPYNFLIQHYPIRSQEQGERKLTERRLRWRPEERARGWHEHYDGISADHDFLHADRVRHPFDLHDFYFDYFVERVTGTLHDETGESALRRLVELAKADQGRLMQRAGSSPRE